MDHLVVVTTTQASKEALPGPHYHGSVVVVWRLSVCRCPPLSLWMHLRRRARCGRLLLAYLRRLDCSLHFVSQTGAEGQWVCRGLLLLRNGIFTFGLEGRVEVGFD